MCKNISFHKIPLSDIFLLKQNFALYERVYLVNMADIKALEYSTMKVSKLQ